MLDTLSETILCGGEEGRGGKARQGEARGLIFQLKGTYNTYLVHLPHHFRSN